MAAQYPFQCACTCCNLGNSHDEKLKEIRDLQEALENLTLVSTDDAQHLIQLYEEANFQAFLDLPYGIAAKSFDATGDRGTAIKYAKLAIDVRSAFNGIDVETDERIGELQELMERNAW